MRILGLDPGLNITGYGFVEVGDDGLIQKYEAGIIKVPRGEYSKRLAFLFSEIQKGIDQFQPDVMAMESGFSGRFRGTTILIGYSRAVCLIAAGLKGLTVKEYAPATIKQAVTSRGDASKTVVAQHVSMIITGKWTQDSNINFDATDALAVAVCHLNFWKAAAIGSKINRP